MAIAMNRWDTIKEIQKHSSGLKEVIYYFEEYTTQAEKYDEDNVKSVRFILPLPVCLFPLMGSCSQCGKAVRS